MPFQKNALNILIWGWSVWCQFCCLIQHIFFGNLNCFRRYSGLLRRLQWWALEWLQLWSINFGYKKSKWFLHKCDQVLMEILKFFEMKDFGRWLRNRRNILESILEIRQIQLFFLLLEFLSYYGTNCTAL